MADLLRRTALFQGTSSRNIWLAAVVFVLALGTPTAVLVYTSYQQIKFESIHQQRLLAEELTLRIEQQLQEWIIKEEVRTFADYNFLVVQGDAVTNFLQPSPLADLEASSDIPGLIGYFQVDADGSLSSPILPESPQQAQTYGINQQQFLQRQILFQQLQQILLDNDLLPAKAPAEEKDDARTLAAGESGAADVAEYATSAPSPAVLEESAPQRDRRAPTSQVTVASEPFSEEKDKVQTKSAPELKNQFGFDQLLQEQRKSEAETEVNAAELKKTSADNNNANGNALAVADSRLETIEVQGSRITRKEKIRLPEPVSAPKQEQDMGFTDDFDAVSAGVAESALSRQQAEAVEAAPATVAPVQPVSATSAGNQTHITLFESEVEPMEFARLTGGNWIFFRKVWRDGQRIIQGGLVDSEAFIQRAFQEPFFSTGLSNNSVLQVFVNGYRISDLYQPDEDYLLNRESYRAIPADREFLFKRHLPAPFNTIELSFDSTALPLGPGGRVISWAAFIMAVVLFGGCYLLVRMGTRQLNLVRQQQDFVSAVSHELKTPLTSIRMYGEMLREGWADEHKRKEYYNYIFDESERLSRLIANVLQLAKMNRNEMSINLKSVAVGELLDNTRSKLNQQIESAGFEFELVCVPELKHTTVMVDADAFMQVFINLIDNAIKFSKKAPVKKILFTVDTPHDQRKQIRFRIRDFGPGIAKLHLKKIFGLFYRAENELTRETVGTGIGLALVNQLVRSMGGSVDVVNCEPGAEFRVTLNCEKS